MNLPRLILLLLAAAATSRAAEINGTVRSVTGDVATVAMKGDVMPPNDARAEFFFKMAGFDEEISVGTGSVLRIERGDLLLKIENATGNIESGHLVRFSFSPASTLATLSPSITPAPAQPESRAVAATETALTPTRAEVLRYYAEGLARSKAKDFKGALASFNKIIELDPTNPKAYGNRANVYHSLKQSEPCLADANEAIRLNPQEAAFYLVRANCYLITQKLKRAFEDFDEAIRLDPKFAVAFYNRGTVYLRQGKNKIALEDLTRAIELNPAYEDAFFNRAQAYKALGRTKLAKQDLAKVRELEAAAKTNSFAKPTPAPPEQDQ